MIVQSEFYIPLNFGSLIFVRFLQFSPKVQMVQRNTVPLIMDILIPEEQGSGSIRDRQHPLSVKKHTFLEKRTWQVLDPATLLSFRNSNVHYQQDFKMRYTHSNLMRNAL